MAVQTVSGQHLPIIGPVKVTLHLAGGEYPCELKVIRGLSYDAVPGQDFLYDTGASIHLKTNTLELDDKSTYEAAIPGYPGRRSTSVLQVRLVCLKSPPLLAECYQPQGATSWNNPISTCKEEVASANAEEDIYTVGKLLQGQRNNREHHFPISASQHNGEAHANIVDKRLTDEFHKQHPRAKRYKNGQD